MNERELIEKLKQQFGAEMDEYIPDKEKLRFLDERSRLEEETAWSLEGYTENHETLKKYGLDQKLINQFEWLIVFYLENKKEEFLGSLFYRQFKDHEVVQRAFSEYERRMEIKK